MTIARPRHSKTAASKRLMTGQVRCGCARPDLCPIGFAGVKTARVFRGFTRGRKPPACDRVPPSGDPDTPLATAHDLADGGCAIRPLRPGPYAKRTHHLNNAPQWRRGDHTMRLSSGFRGSLV